MASNRTWGTCCLASQKTGWLHTSSFWIKKWNTLIHPRDNQEGYDCITKVSQNINLPACKYFFMQCIARHDLSSNSCDTMYWKEITGGSRFFNQLTLIFLGLWKMPVFFQVFHITVVTRVVSPVCVTWLQWTIQGFEILTCPGGLAASTKTMAGPVHPSPGGNSTQVLPVELAIDHIAVVPQIKGCKLLHS